MINNKPFRLVLLPLLLACGLTAYAGKSLVITLASGTKVYYPFEKFVPLIRFSDGVMQVNTRKYTFSRVASFEVVEESDAVGTLPSTPDFSMDGDVLAVASLQPVRISNLQGVLQPVSATVSAEMQYIDLSSLPQGPYVVMCGRSSFTIYKK